IEETRSREKAMGEKLVELSSAGDSSGAKQLGEAKLYVSRDPSLGEDQIIAQGEKSVVSDPALIYVALFSTGKSARIICFVGQSAVKSGYSAAEIVRSLAPMLGGSGGGSPSFAQGGGPMVGKLDEAASAAERLALAR
ncbi:MAG TPA: DHHA1 domain-containing protein, partial [Nitrososphaerales archaeon]|nr:DHHA1 domain-containing protein [Nitrososphaerales archaeon]